MNNEIKRKLELAGFEDIEQNDWLILKNTALYKIYINFELSRVAIDNKNDKLVLSGIEFKDLDQLNKICYPFNGCQDLNFEEKQYTWEECFKTKIGFYVGGNGGVYERTSLNKSTLNKTVCPTEKSAISIEATTQLMQICAKINEDFPSEDEYDYYPHLDMNGKLDWVQTYHKYNSFKMNSAAGVKALLESNTPLLNQYFEHETT